MKQVVDGQPPIGQYILVQRPALNDPHHHNVPRSSSAPPAHHQGGGATSAAGGASQVVSVDARGRPASVEAEHPSLQLQQQPSQEGFVVQCPNPGTQAVTRRQRLPPGKHVIKL